MEVIKAIFMGFIQGLTEFLPVSSSGHLAITSQLLNVQLDEGVVFELLLHFGTLVAVFIVFWKDIVELVKDGFIIVGDFFVIGAQRIFRRYDKIENRKIINSENKRFVMLIIVSSIPTAIMAFILESAIEASFETLLIPGIGLIFTGILLITTKYIKEGNNDAKDTSYFKAIAIGIAQGLATLPGISRSGSTLVMGLSLKLKRSFAVKYSFIMSIPVILGAAMVKVIQADFSNITNQQLLGYILGTLTSAIVGFICIKTLLAVIRRNKLYYFAYYCFAIGICAIAGHFML
jgi:undecaprenyl-diphosphatase